MSVCSDQREDGESTAGSSEAKTDRYGFLLVNGDTNNDSDDPCPELVRHREMKWITLMNQWDQVLEKKHSKIKAQCQKGIPASVRSRCWPLLCGAKQRKENNKDLYNTLETSPGQQSWIDVIQRDTDRQFPFHEMFQSKDSLGQQGLLQVLKAYTQFRPDEGYCQAQGPVAAVLLMNMPMEEAFWCLVQISELYLPGYYSPLLEGVLFDAAILFSVLKRTCPAAYKHMHRQGVEPLMFATDWLMCLYSRHLPFNTLLRVWDLFFCNGVRVLFQVAVVLVRRCLGEARQRKECEGQMETLERLRSVKGCVQNEPADAFIQEVSSVPLSVAELHRQTEKELEKWRKERPGSTFDPRDRCHGYHMIWEKGKEREKENEKKGRQSGTLGASLMRSHSSLSPAILRKKWRKRGSKAGTEEGEGRGFSKQDSDEEEKRRASVCGVAGEVRAKTNRTPQELGTDLRKDGNTSANTWRTSATETQPCSESSDHSGTVFEEDENEVAAPPIPSHTENGEREEGTSPPPSSLKEDGLQTGCSLQEDEEQKIQTLGNDQGEEISTHQDQPETETQQEESQPLQIQERDNARDKLEEETQENRCKQEEEIENKTFKPEEEVQLNLNTQAEEMNITRQEVEVEVNTDTQKKEIQICSGEQEQENEKNSKHEEEIQMDSSGEEKEIGASSQKQQHADSSEEEAVKNIIKQEKEIQTKSSEQEAEKQEEKVTKSESSKQEVEIQVENDIKTNSSEQEVEKQEERETMSDSSKEEVEIQDTNEIMANSSEQEVEKQEERETMSDSSKEEVEIQDTNEIKADSSEQEVEIQEERETMSDSSEQEVEKQEEEEIKANSSVEEVEIQEEREINSNISKHDVQKQEEKETKSNSSKQEVEIQDEEKLANSDNEEEKLKSCPTHVDEQQEQEVHSEAPEDQQGAEEDAPSVQEKDEVKGELCQNKSNTDVNRTQEDEGSETERSEEIEKEAGISNLPAEETEGTVMEEEKRNSNHVTGDEEQSETVGSSPCIQPEIKMEHGTESEPAQDSKETQEENLEVNKISTPEHGEPDKTSGSSNPEPPQLDNKEEEVEIEKHITTGSNPVAPPAPSGSNPPPHLCLRRSSSSHTSYPTILSEDTFKDPQQSIKHDPQTTKAEQHQTPTQPAQTHSPKAEKAQAQAAPTTPSKSDKPKRKGLFHRLRSDPPPKSTIPKIVIQDFSEGEEKLSSKERRRRRRMQERKEKEEEKERKRLEKELEKEKERERKKPQTRGRSFQVLNKKHEDGDVFSGKSGSQVLGRKRNTYSESYF